MSKVKLPFEDKFVVLTGTWEGRVTIYVYPLETLRKELSFEVKLLVENVIYERLKPLFDSNNPQGSLNRIYNSLKESYYELFGDVHQFIREYNGRAIGYPNIILRENDIKLMYEEGMFITIYITTKKDLKAYVDFNFPKAVDIILNNIPYRKQRIELLDGICCIEGELSDRSANFNLGGYNIYVSFNKHVVKPNSKLVFNCYYSKNNQLFRELTFDEPVLLSYTESSYGREPWYLR